MGAGTPRATTEAVPAAGVRAPGRRAGRAARLGAAAVVIAAAALAAAVPGRPAAAQEDGILGEQEVAARIADAYGVEVLAVQRRDLIGGPAYAVKVMTPQANSNSALMVSTLMVDAATGELIPQFQHRTFGYRDRGRPTLAPDNPTVGETLRQRSFGQGPESYP